jgi:ADP-ribosylglycohydrolase
MIMPHCSGNFAFMSWSEAALARAGLPRMEYPIPLSAFPEALKRGDVLPVQMLAWLQLFTERDLSAWTCLAPAMTAIARQLAGSYRGLRGEIEGPRWRLSLESVDLSREVVTVQRGAHLVAAIADRGDGGLSVSHYRALDAKAARYLVALGGYPDGTAGMPASSFECAKGWSGGWSHFYAADRGDSYLSYWDDGVGLRDDRMPVQGWIEQRTLTPLPWAELAIELAAQATLDGAGWADPARMPEITTHSQGSPMQTWESLAGYTEIFRRDRAIGALIGLAVGDAVGTTLEFTSRDSRPPLTDMIGGGPFQLERGQWTDDTSMALCLADSLLANDGLDPLDLMRRFCRWRDQGENSCTGSCFDIGGTVGAALWRFERTGDPLAGSSDPQTAGNGSLMRLSPVAIFWRAEPELAERAAAEQSRTTHAAPAAVDACRAFARLLVRAIAGETKQDLLRPWPDTVDLDPAVAAVMAGSWRDKKRDQIQSTGYVVHSLEAALWAVDQAGDFQSAVLAAANLGGDADTVAAIAGQLAGALWGCSSIPESWRDYLAWRARIHDLALALFVAGSRTGAATRSSPHAAPNRSAERESSEREEIVMPDDTKKVIALGCLEPVSVRSVMPHEAYDFTVWLADPENLNLLGTAIGLILEPKATEVGVDEFSADLVCRSLDDGSTILIENQYGRTDHDHLGKLLTYVGGLKASTMVWIAEKIRPAHRAALDWLNESTVEGVNFFGIELELLKIGDSLPAPRFNVVSKPNNWAKQIRASTSQASNADGQRARYWQQIRPAMLSQLPKRLRASKEGNSSSFWVYDPGQGWSWWFTIYVMKKGYVGWFLRAKENALEVFSALQARADELRAACGCDLDLSKPLTIDAWLKANCEDESDWPRQVEWFLTTFPPFANKVVDTLEAENLIPKSAVARES